MSDQPPADTEPPEQPVQRPASARDLQENAGEGRIDTPPGSDADHAAEVPHVG
jgi:hypothetical protein